MIVRNPYDAKPLDLVDVARIKNPLSVYVITDYVQHLNKAQERGLTINGFKSKLNGLEYAPVYLLSLSDSEKEIPAFTHLYHPKDTTTLAMDLRPYVRLNASKDSFEIKNQSEFGLAYRRFILSAQWFTGNEDSIYSLKLSHVAYAEWISDALTKKFGLGLGDQLRLKVLAMIYYASLFSDTFDVDALDKLIIRSKEEIMVPRLIEEIYQEAGTMSDLDAFCEACYLITDNIRLKGLTGNILFTLISNSWMGVHGKELSALSLTHPPTWTALIYTAVTERSYKRTAITNVVERINKRGKGEEFTKTVDALMNSVNGMSNSNW